jgi:hypothetical protein
MDFRCRRRFRIFIGFPGEANFSMLPSYGFSAENLRRLDFRYRIVTVRTDDHRLMFIHPFLRMFLIIQGNFNSTNLGTKKGSSQY